MLISSFFFSISSAQSSRTPADTYLNGKASASGYVTDSENGEPVIQAAVQLYSLPDTLSVTGTVSDNTGRYSFQKLVPGSYLLRYSFMGYVTHQQQFSISRQDREITIPAIRLKADTIMLDGVVVQADLPQMQMVDDTLMYNADAFRVPEGSVLEELIRKLPGVTIDNGTVKVNGKEVKRFLVDGKEFFDYDTNMAMKNLPAEMVDKLKTYERKSDLARVTGIDDGEEETVIDIQVKPNMRRGWHSNMDVSTGIPMGENDYGEWLKGLYNGRVTINRFTSDRRLTINGNTGNLGNGGRAGNGLSYNTQAGIDFTRSIGKPFKGRKNEYPLEMNGNVRYNGSNSRNINESESETYLTSQSGKSFRNNSSSSHNHNNRIDANMRIEWRPDTMSDIIFRPSFSYNTSGSGQNSESVSFNDNPYSYGMTSPLQEYDTEAFGSTMEAIGVNSQLNSSMSRGAGIQVGGQLQANRRFDKKGRNFTMTGNFSISRNSNSNYSASRQKFYQAAERDTIMNRFTDSPSRNNNFSGRIMWSEPLEEHLFLQLSYQIQYRFQDTDRKTYQFPSTLYPNWEETWVLPDDKMMIYYEKDSLSRYQTYRNLDQTIETQLRLNTDKITMNVGFSLLPQHQSMKYKFMGVDTMPSRNIFNWTPTLNFNYKWSRQKNIQITYRGRTNQPGMDQMLNITDNSNPLNIRKGNPDLKPTFNNTLNITFRTNNTDKQRNYNINASAGNTLRNISSRTDYDETTGVSTTQSVNMDGFWSNWNANINFSFGTAVASGILPAGHRININSSTSASYNHQEGYMRSRSTYNSSQAGAQLSTTRSNNAGETFRATYQNEWLETGINASVNYMHSQNSLMSTNTTNTLNYSYGARLDIRKTNWKNLRLNTDITMQSRRGYSSASYNRNELIWNMQLSVNLFKKNAGTISAQWYDILNKRSNINHNVSATGRSDSRNNNINSYVVIHFIYRLNLFGDKNAREQMRQAGRTAQNGPSSRPQEYRPGQRGGMPAGGRYPAGR